MNRIIGLSDSPAQRPVNRCSSESSLDYLCQTDINILSQVEPNVSVFFGTQLLSPVVDGTFIKERPIELLKGDYSTDTERWNTITVILLSIS
jgi:hypothetical protein